MVNTSFTLPKTNSSHLKIDLWKRRFLLEITIFSGATLVSGRVIVLYDHSQTHRIHRTTVYLTTLSCLIFMGISCRESHIITSWCSFTNPFETNAQVKLGSFPQIGMNIKNIWVAITQRYIEVHLIDQVEKLWRLRGFKNFCFCYAIFSDFVLGLHRVAPDKPPLWWIAAPHPSPEGRLQVG